MELVQGPGFGRSVLAAISMSIKENWMPTQNAVGGPSSEKRKRKIEPININTLEVMTPNPFLLEAANPANSCTQWEGNLPLRAGKPSRLPSELARNPFKNQSSRPKDSSQSCTSTPRPRSQAREWRHCQN